MQQGKKFKNIQKKHASVEHAFSYLERHYIYVFTPLKPDTVILDYIGLFKARATEDIVSLDCHEGYKDCFNFLLKKNRRVMIWSKNRNIKKLALSSRPGDPFEYHKHPIAFKKPIKKGESFDWVYHSQYTLYTPTKERIAAIRKGHFWDSKNALFRFYDTLHQVEHGYSFHFFAPVWLMPYNRSFVYKGIDLDGIPLDDVTLATLGVQVKRMYQIDMSPRLILKPLLSSWKMKINHWRKDYYLMTEDVSLKSWKPEQRRIIMTFGFLMPEAKEWRKYLKKKTIRGAKKKKRVS